MCCVRLAVASGPFSAQMFSYIPYEYIYYINVTLGEISSWIFKILLLCIHVGVFKPCHAYGGQGPLWSQVPFHFTVSRD